MELRDELRKSLKRSRMSLDGVRKYYGVQRRLIEQRLSVLETGRGVTKTGASADDEMRIAGWKNTTASAMHLRDFKAPPLAELLDAGECASTGSCG